MIAVMGTEAGRARKAGRVVRSCCCMLARFRPEPSGSVGRLGNDLNLSPPSSMYRERTHVENLTCFLSVGQADVRITDSSDTCLASAALR
jgi:hypothetical protein